MSNWAIYPKQTQFKPKKTPFQSQNILPRVTINGRHNSLFYCAAKIETAVDRLWGRFLLTKRAFFYSMYVLETNICNGLQFLSLMEEKSRLYAKKQATEENDDFIGTLKQNTAILFGTANFLEILRC